MANVLVTGATGYIAGHVIHQLLEAGHTVRGTLRSKAKGEALLAALSDYAGRPVSVELVEADLSSDAGWQEACAGTDYVMHTASPIPQKLPRDHEALIRPARDGALRVLKAAKHAGVKRVVMTSSIAAIAYGHGEARPALLDETHWSNPDNLKDNTAYTRSKTLAEKAAWDYVNGEGAGLEMATINPSAVLGPVMSGDFSTSLEILTQPMQNKIPAMPPVGFEVVDVRDVASAHLLAMTHPAAAGERFAVTQDFYWFKDVVAVLREAFPERKFAKSVLPGWLLKLLVPINPVLGQLVPEIGQQRRVSHQKAINVLGWQPRKAREAILDGAKSLIEKGVV